MTFDSVRWLMIASQAKHARRFLHAFHKAAVPVAAYATDFEASAALPIQSRNSSSNIGAAKMISLDGVAAHGAKDIGLRHGLDGFGNDFAANALDELDDSLDDHPGLFA